MLSYKLFQQLFALPLKYFEARRVGETVARVRELDSIRSFLTGTPLSSMIDLLFIVIYIIILFLYNPNLTLIVLGSIPIFALLSAIITPLFKKRLDEKFNTGAETQSFLVESISGVQTVKSFSLANRFEKKWGDLQSDYVTASYKTSMVSLNDLSVAYTGVHNVTLLVRGSEDRLIFTDFRYNENFRNFTLEFADNTVVEIDYLNSTLKEVSLINNELTNPTRLSNEPDFYTLANSDMAWSDSLSNAPQQTQNLTDQLLVNVV